MTSSTDKMFAGSIPEIYDAYLVPLIFKSYAADLAARVSAAAPQTVLETAAGSGVVPRALAPLLDINARYVITDLNQPMLDRAIARQPPDARIVWQQADAMKLPFEIESFDAVCCQFGVMFFPDRVAGYREALRVLKPAATFSSTSGTALKKTTSPMSLLKRPANSSQTIRPCFSHERRTAIMMWARSRQICAPLDSRPSGSKR